MNLQAKEGPAGEAVRGAQVTVGSESKGFLVLVIGFEGCRVIGFKGFRVLGS